MSKRLISVLSFLILILGLLATNFTINAQSTITIDGKLGMREWDNSKLNYIVTENSVTNTSVEIAYTEWIFDESSKQLFIMFFIQDTLATKSNSFSVTGYLNNSKVFVLSNNKSAYCAKGYTIDYAFNVLGNGNGYMVEVALDLPSVPDNLTLGVEITDPNLKTTPKSNVKIFIRETTTSKPTTTKTTKPSTTKKNNPTTTKPRKTTTTKINKTTTTKVTKTTTTNVSSKPTTTKISAEVKTTKENSTNINTENFNSATSSSYNVSSNISNEIINNSTYNDFENSIDPNTYESSSDEILIIENADNSDNMSSTNSDDKKSNEQLSPSNVFKKIFVVGIAVLMLAAAIFLIIFASRKKENENLDSKE